MADWQTPPKVEKLTLPRRWFSGALLGLAGVVVIAGCSSDGDQVVRALEALGADQLTLSQETRHELDRFAGVYQASVSEPIDSDLDYFRFALRRVKTAYVHQVPDEDLVSAAIEAVEDDSVVPEATESEVVVETALRGMLRSLDPHSDYLNADQFEELFRSNAGQFGGLGIEVIMEDDFVKVVSPIEDTPAARAGLQAGDLIVQVDGESIKGKTLRDAVSKMRGAPGTSILLTIRRADRPDFDVEIIRDIINVAAVKWRREGDVGYVRVTRFTEKVEDGIAKAMAELSTVAGASLKGVVLDLRSNPGGLLDQSVILADSFLDQGEIVSVRGRTADNKRSYPASPGDLARNVPMVVLINGGSASASEIVASALQYHQRAIVMGRASFGKGSVQTIMPLPGHGALRLTTALYYSPSGHTIQAKGVVPDIWVKSEQEIATIKREADLPGAIKAEDWRDPTLSGRPIVKEDSCPAIEVPNRVETKDRVLGCAIKYLEAGSQDRFLADLDILPAS